PRESHFTLIASRRTLSGPSVQSFRLAGRAGPVRSRNRLSSQGAKWGQWLGAPYLCRTVFLGGRNRVWLRYELFRGRLSDSPAVILSYTVICGGSEGRDDTTLPSRGQRLRLIGKSRECCRRSLRLKLGPLTMSVARPLYPRKRT